LPMMVGAVLFPIGLFWFAWTRLGFNTWGINTVAISYRISQYCKDWYRIDTVSILHRLYPSPH
jgi:hypothetical protein